MTAFVWRARPALVLQRSTVTKKAYGIVGQTDQKGSFWRSYRESKSSQKREWNRLWPRQIDSLREFAALSLALIKRGHTPCTRYAGTERLAKASLYGACAPFGLPVTAQKNASFGVVLYGSPYGICTAKPVFISSKPVVMRMALYVKTYGIVFL